MDESLFKELGLTGAETAVYIALLKLGTAYAGAIIDESKLQTSVVHRALNALIEKGLINFVVKGKHRVYQSTDPKTFLKFIEEKKERFEQMLPELEKTYNFHQSKEAATVYSGLNGIREVYYKLIEEKNEEYITFGGGPPTAEVMGFHFWMNLHRKRVDNKMNSRQIFDLSVRPIGGIEIEQLPLTNIRYLSSEFAQFQETVIVGDYVAINVFTQNPYSFLIKDRNVAQGYKKYFETLWLQAKEYDLKNEFDIKNKKSKKY
jgi:sugar-specific transcriptional regulator TrmB